MYLSNETVKDSLENKQGEELMSCKEAVSSLFKWKNNDYACRMEVFTFVFRAPHKVNS